MIWRNNLRTLRKWLVNHKTHTHKIVIEEMHLVPAKFSQHDIGYMLTKICKNVFCYIFTIPYPHYCQIPSLQHFFLQKALPVLLGELRNSLSTAWHCGYSCWRFSNEYHSLCSPIRESDDSRPNTKLPCSQNSQESDFILPIRFF